MAEVRYFSLAMQVFVMLTSEVGEDQGSLNVWLLCIFVSSLREVNSCSIFVIVFTTSYHRPLSWPRWVQFRPSCPISLRYILLLFSLYVDTSKYVLPLSFSESCRKPPMRAACPSHRTVLYLVIQTKPCLVKLQMHVYSRLCHFPIPHT
jgi:hypothetical protein